MELLEWRLYAGELARVPEMRALVRKVVPTCSRRNDLEIVTSEVAANAILHTPSGAPGGKVGLALYRSAPGRVLVRVYDAGGRETPHVAAYTSEADSAGAELSSVGRGLILVAALADSWGYADTPCGRFVWAAFDIPEIEAVTGDTSPDACSAGTRGITQPPESLARTLLAPN